MRSAKTPARVQRCTVRRLSPTCWAMAGAVQPWWCKAQTCVCSACRRAWRCPARCWAGVGVSRGGWHGHRDRPLGQQDRLLAHQGIDGLEGVFMGQKHLVERFPEILQQVETVCDLRGSRSPLACARGIGL